MFNQPVTYCASISKWYFYSLPTANFLCWFVQAVVEGTITNPKLSSNFHYMNWGRSTYLPILIYHLIQPQYKMLSCLPAPSNIVGWYPGLLQLGISTKAAHGNFESLGKKSIKLNVFFKIKWELLFLVHSPLITSQQYHIICLNSIVAERNICHQVAEVSSFY